MFTLKNHGFAVFHLRRKKVHSLNQDPKNQKPNNRPPQKGDDNNNSRNARTIAILVICALVAALHLTRLDS